MMLTMDRFDIAKKTWEDNIKNARYELGPDCEFELMVCDNGSKDLRSKQYFDSQDLAYFRNNRVNEGVGKSLNQLYLRSTGDIIAAFGNDLRMPKGWLKEAMGYAMQIPNSGIIGFDWGHGQIPALTTKFGSHALWLDEKLNRVFGTWVFKRSLVESLGFFNEEFHIYGLEDSEFNERVNRSGYNSCYVPLMKCEHVCHDVGTSSEYRKMKDESLSKNTNIFGQRIKFFDEGGSLKCDLPPLREST